MPKEKTKPSTRGAQPYTGGLGQNFSTPPKIRNKRKTMVLAAPLGIDREHQFFKEQYKLLRAGNLSNTQQLEAIPEEPRDETNLPLLEGSSDNQTKEDQTESLPSSQLVDGPNDVEELPFNDCEIPDQPAKPSNPIKRRLVPDNTANHLYHRWLTILPELVPLLTKFIAMTIGVRTTGRWESTLRPLCTNQGECGTTSLTVLSLLFDSFQEVTVHACHCQNFLQVLVSNGLFPTSPSKPRVAISIHLLDFYESLFEKSCDATNAIASALNSHYGKRGFVFLNHKGNPVQDAFRRGITSAIQWYDSLKRLVFKKVEAAIEEADNLLRTAQENGQAGQAGENSPQCAKVLQDRCPACFAGTTFGRPWEEGGDIHVALDGNFNHRHLRTAGECPKFYQPDFFLPKEQVDAVGKRIEALRKAPKKNAHKPQVPDEAIDECENGHTAGKGHAVKTNMEKFDAGGLMGMTCRHDIPLFMANIDTPGEQQKYGVALIEHLYTLVPTNTRITALYDVGCVLDRSIQTHGFLPTGVIERLRFGTSAMHAYVHQWACQLVFNPRLQVGFGLTDGEGLERLWSRLRMLIGITRSSSASRRIWLLDRHAGFIAQDLRNDLGHWIKRKLKKGVQAQGDAANKKLEECKIMIEELEKQWDLQRKAQLSLRAHAPARLRKELDHVLTLQTELESVDQAIETTRAVLVTTTTEAPQADLLITGLEALQTGLKEKVEVLYASLNVQESFPELAGMDLQFVRTLIMARDLKINIRKRAIGSFFEWDKLDQAAGGREQILGTKLHQSTRKAISKRAPAIMTAIRKYNKYCEKLSQLHQEDWNIPLPEPLPTELSQLRSCPHLMEDVWIKKGQAETPQWLEDLEVREGIRAMLKRKRCAEETRRLVLETDNLCRWYGRRLQAVELAFCLSPDPRLQILLAKEKQSLLHLKDAWSSPLGNEERYNEHLRNVHKIAAAFSSDSATAPRWIPCQTTSTMDPDEENDEEASRTDAAVDARRPPEVKENAEELIVQDFLEDQDRNDERSPLVGLASQVADILWCIPENYRIDSTILQDLQKYPSERQDQSHDTRRYTGQNNRFVDFDARELGIMHSPTAWLNDVCINGLALVLQEYFSQQETFANSSSRCAIFSTYMLPKVRYNAHDQEIRRNCIHNKYWTKDLWILPIHRKRPSQHWVLAVVSPTLGQIFAFDSFAERNPWKREIQDVQRLVAQLVSIAGGMGFNVACAQQAWKVQPLTVDVRQTNGHDCGVWVLAMISAVLRGFHSTALTEREIGSFRSALYELLLRLPYK